MRIQHGARRTRLLVLAALLLASILVSGALAFSTASAQTVAATLVWTAPGDDGTIGRATVYDLRISSTAISGTDTLSWWNAASIVNMASKVPALSGALDSMAVTNLLSNTRYYAIIRAADEVPNWSGFSNVAVIDTRDLIAPLRVTDLRAR